MLTLKADPTFVAKVPIHKPGGDKVEVPFRFRHRTRTVYEAWVKDSRQKTDLDVVMEAVTGWELTDEFSRDNVADFLENWRGAARAISATYSRELTDQRLGN